jgi:hypothetical protein
LDASFCALSKKKQLFIMFLKDEKSSFLCSHNLNNLIAYFVKH